jgi:hypothetical protein
MSAASSVSGTRRKSHRAGVKYKARREAQALYKMTSAGMEPLEPEEREDVYDSEGESINGEQGQEDEEYGRHSEPDAPSLTYDSDEHEDDHEELEAPEELFNPGEIGEAVDSKPDLDGGKGVLTYVERIGAEVEIGTYRNESGKQRKLVQMRISCRRKSKLIASCKRKLLRRKFWIRRPQWWSRRKKYQLRNGMLLLLLQRNTQSSCCR